MWHLMRKGKGLLFFCFFAEIGFSQSQQDLSILPRRSYANSTSSMSIAKQAELRKSSWSVSPEVGIGYGRFQNIVIPADEGSSDPRQSLKNSDVTEQAGVPLILGLGLTYPEMFVRSATDFNFLRMNTMMERSPGQKSTPGFSRMELSQTIALDFQDRLWTLSGVASYRRDSFKDGSFAHVVDAVMLKGGAELNVFETALGAYYGQSVHGSFAFTNKSSLNVDHVPGSSASAQVMGGTLRRGIGRSSEFNLGVEHETVSIRYPIRGAYENFGLAGDVQDDTTRSLTLTTDLLSLSLIKHF